MPALPLASPEELHIDPAALGRAHDLLRRWVETDRIPAAGLCVGRNGRALPPRFFGPLRDDALFLVASITKPVTATAVMLLVERGQLALHDRVGDFLPHFAVNGKEETRLLHLLTHTSGLPDMVPENLRLRREHQPLAAFVEETCRLAPKFRPGTAVSYQSMGSAILAEVVHQVSGRLLPEFLRREVFEPLGMADTSLGWDPDRRERIAPVRLPEEQRGADWGWNSPYWLGLGVPWGGLITSPTDLARFCLMLLAGGALGDVRVLSPATVTAMTTNQLATLPEVPGPTAAAGRGASAGGSTGPASPPASATCSARAPSATGARPARSAGSTPTRAPSWSCSRPSRWSTTAGPSPASPTPSPRRCADPFPSEPEA